MGECVLNVGVQEGRREESKDKGVEVGGEKNLIERQFSTAVIVV